jgi:hypothetical protein
MVTTQREKAKHGEGREQLITQPLIARHGALVFDDVERLCGPDSVHWNFSG